MRRGRHSRQREQDVQRPSGRRERGEYKGGEESDCGYVTSGKCAGEIGVGWLRGTYFGHLMRRVDSLEKTLMLGGDWGQEEKGTTEDALQHIRLT